MLVRFKTIEDQLVEIAREAAEVLALVESGNIAAINTKARAHILAVVERYCEFELNHTHPCGKRVALRHKYHGDGIGPCLCGLSAEHDIHDQVGDIGGCEGQDEPRTQEAPRG